MCFAANLLHQLLTSSLKAHIQNYQKDLMLLEFGEVYPQRRFQLFQFVQYAVVFIGIKKRNSNKKLNAKF